MNETQRVIDETVDWIGSCSWDYFVTLNFKSGSRTDEMVERVVLKFVGILSKKVFGARSRKRVKVFAVHEKHQSGGSHVHLLLEDPRIRQCQNRTLLSGKEIRSHVLDAWKESHSSTGTPMLSNSEEWFKPVTDIGGAIGYMLKQFNKSYSPVLWSALSLDGRRNG